MYTGGEFFAEDPNRMITRKLNETAHAGGAGSTCEPPLWSIPERASYRLAAVARASPGRTLLFRQSNGFPPGEEVAAAGRRLWPCGAVKDTTPAAFLLDRAFGASGTVRSSPTYGHSLPLPSRWHPQSAPDMRLDFRGVKINEVTNLMVRDASQFCPLPQRSNRRFLSLGEDAASL